MSDVKIRLQFSKNDRLRYIGHLDFLRVFQQTIRRAKLPAAFSQGFNPHLQISFALPLSLGLASENDYADITLTHEIAAEEIVQKLNAVAPSGLNVKAAYPAKNKAASVVSVADYILDELPANPASIKHIMSADEIVIAKKSKKGIKDTDIRPDIFLIEKQDEKILMRLSAGSARFLNPLLVLELLFPASEGYEDSRPTAASLTRTELYLTDENGKIKTL